jgi:subtilisin family serine protease
MTWCFLVSSAAIASLLCEARLGSNNIGLVTDFPEPVTVLPRPMDQMPHPRTRWLLVTALLAVIGFLLAGALSAAFAAVAPENGWWWSPQEPGRGYSLEIRDGRAFIGAYAYRSDGTAVWYVAEATYDGTSMSSPLTEYGGGQTLDGAWRVAQPQADAGRTTLTFSSPTRGSILWNTGHRTEIERFIFAASASAAASAAGSSANAGGRPPPGAARSMPAPADLAREAVASGRTRVIIRFRDAETPASDQRARAMALIERAGGQPLHLLRGGTVLVARVTPELLEALLALPGVANVRQDGLSRVRVTDNVAKIGADRIWAQGYTGGDRTVAVLDTGVDPGHPYLGGRVVDEACFSSIAPEYRATSLCPTRDDTQFGAGAAQPCTISGVGCDHGTHVAGIIAGSLNGLTGVAPQAKIMAIQVFSRFQGPSVCDGAATCIASFDSDQLRALEYVRDRAAAQNVAAVNMSLGGDYQTGYCDGDSRKPVIDQLRASGVATVVATGNDGNNFGINAPACISSAMRVGATTLSDTISSFTNLWGQPVLLAPGSMITSSTTGGGFATYSGTSMATPHVAGAVALLRSARPDMSIDAIAESLSATGRRLSRNPGGTGFPRIDAAAAYASLTGIETGWWWNADEPGRGFFIEVQNNQIFMSAYVYDGAGQSVWYIASGPMAAGVFQGRMQEYAGGQELLGPWREARVAVDRGPITLLGDGKGNAYLTLSTGRTVKLVRFASF